MSRTIGVRGTALYMIFTVTQEKLWLAVTSAGHPSLILIRGNQPTFLPPDNDPAAGPMLGVAELKQPLAAHRKELREGDLLIAFSDGVCNSSNPYTQRLEVAKAALEADSRDPDVVAKAILNQVSGGTGALDDDATVLVIRVT
jgi:serine phosphatase RsbU (regulator of sigma subunit)